MEISLDKVMDETLARPGVYGCIFSDDHGLGLGARGQASVDSSGVVAALAMVAAKLEPKDENPIITFQNENRTCIIKRSDNLIAAIFKTTEKS